MIKELIKSFTILPGIGNKSAARFVYYLLEHNKDAGLMLAKNLQKTIENIKNCANCRTLTEKNLCSICNNSKRDNKKICIVETPNDIVNIENSGAYNGKYFVLGGYLSPIDNIGEQELGINTLIELVKNNNIKELILAVRATIEGDITSNYIESIFKKNSVKITHLARGIPVGGELEYTDINTIARAIIDRY